MGGGHFTLVFFGDLSASLGKTLDNFLFVHSINNFQLSNPEPTLHRVGESRHHDLSLHVHALRRTISIIYIHFFYSTILVLKYFHVKDFQLLTTFQEYETLEIRV